MLRNIVAGLTVFVMLSASTVMGQVADKEKIAVAAAEKWLILIDGGKYGQSWKEAAGFFRTAVKQEQWEQMVQAVRRPLGKLLSRKMKSKSYTTSLPGAPDGEYVVIQFDTSFENKKSAIETVTPVKDKDGKWRVSGYYINQPARKAN